MAVRKHPVTSALGWFGVVLSILAYLLVSFSWITSQNPLFQWLNLGGAVCIGIETYYKRDFQPFWLNVIWGGIALASLASMLVNHSV